MAVYGLQADVLANQGKDVQLYIPGQTKLTSQDIFLGGPGTGIDDTQLNGATRVHGDTAEDTAYGFDRYMDNMRNGIPIKTKDAQGNDDLASQLRTVISANYAPRADAEMGAPTLARQNMENGQVQNQIGNALSTAQLTGKYNGQDTLAQKSFDHNVAQDAFSNEYNVGGMMGTYKGNDTLSKQAQAIQQAQNEAENKYRYDALAASQARASGGSSGSKTPSVTELNYQDKQNSQQVTAQAMAKLQEKANLGWTRDQVLNWMYANSGAFISNGVDMNNLSKLASSAYTWNGEDESRYE